MPFRQRVAQKWGETVSKETEFPDTPNSTMISQDTSSPPSTPGGRDQVGNSTIVTTTPPTSPPGPADLSMLAQTHGTQRADETVMPNINGSDDLFAAEVILTLAAASETAGDAEEVTGAPTSAKPVTKCAKGKKGPLAPAGDMKVTKLNKSKVSMAKTKVTESTEVTKATKAPKATARRKIQQPIYRRCTRSTRSATREFEKELGKDNKLTADAPQLAPDSAYLSYYDIRLTYDDVRSLRSEWLTDNNIAFWEEWLEREILPKYPQARIILLRPSMTFLLMKERDPKSAVAALPNLAKATHIFLPVNDNRNAGVAEGGSHWSLLLVSTLDGVAFHYDSMGSSNYAEARHCAAQVAEFLGRPIKFQQITDCPQQENGSDCGVFVCILMRHLLVKRLLNANAREKVSMSMENKMIDSYGGRKEMLRIVESLRKEGERRRSASPFPSSNDSPPRIG